jgi:hypothetical protein
MEALAGLAMMSSSTMELWRASRGDCIKNAALPRLGLMRKEDEEIAGLKAERGT